MNNPDDTQTNPENAPKATRRRVAFQSIGCKLNQYEIEALQHRFTSGDNGDFDIVGFSEEADIYVVNTCTVTGSGDADSRKAVRRARRRGPDSTVVATGCYAQRRPQDLRLAGADLIVGNGQKGELFEAVDALLSGNRPEPFDPCERPKTQRFLQIDGVVPKGRTRGILQIQDGCDEHCTYCVIPSVRGLGVSRPVEEVVEQATRMVEAGYVELALTGVHSGSYGDGESELIDLLRRLEDVDGLQRLRINSIEPGWVTDAVIDHVAASKVVCRHFHIPLQSGDNHILRRMGRRYSTAYYRERIERIAAAIPECAIGADVMVGFPGESSVRFSGTAAFLEEIPLTYLHVFTYSRRPGTPAERLPGHVDPQTMKDRNRTLTGISESKRLAFNRRFLGRTVFVLIEETMSAGSGLAKGTTDNYLKVLVEPSQRIAVNRISQIRITNAREDLLYGEELS